MHIPDGFIDVKTAAVTAGLSAAGVGLALSQVKRQLPPRKVPMLGLSAAFLFAAQMVNFPVAAGTSGHLIGGALVTALLGPAAAIVVVTAVLIVQCFLFADGGVVALGANVFNMAILGAGGSALVLAAVKRLLPGERGLITGVAFAGWCSVLFAALGCAGQLAWSGTVSWKAAFPAMTLTHIIIGIGEGVITALVFLFVQRTRPDIATASESGQRRDLLFVGALITVGMILFVAPFACPWPDGLESVAARLGFEHKAAEPVPAPMPDYAVPGIHWAIGTTAVAGLTGAVVVFGLAWLLARMLVRRGDAAPSK